MKEIKEATNANRAFRKLLVTAAVALVTPALLSGCSNSGGSGGSGGDSEMNQIANPASVYCIEQGGTIEIVNEAAGEVGYCNLPDGTRVEEWEYFRANNPEGQ